jgi:hypothetical protein
MQQFLVFSEPILIRHQPSENQVNNNLSVSFGTYGTTLPVFISDPDSTFQKVLDPYPDSEFLYIPVTISDIRFGFIFRQKFTLPGPDLHTGETLLSVHLCVKSTGTLILFAFVLYTDTY